MEISEEKTKIVSICHGVDFISRTYVKRDGNIYVTPSKAAVEREKAALRELIATHTRSQKSLIDSINRKLSGWASYHRYADARAAFREIDQTVEDSLWKAALEHHPKMNPPKIRAKYWYTNSRGESVYSLPGNRSVCEKRLSDTLLVQNYEKIPLNKNPYIDRKYFESRNERKAIVGVSGRYREIWKRQQGRCYLCGRPILPDQSREVIQIDMGEPRTLANLVYVHGRCRLNELSVFEVLGDIGVYTARELVEACQDIDTAGNTDPREKLPGPMRENWPFQPLKQWFARENRASITLTFKDIETILERKLSASARKYPYCWYTRPDGSAMAEAWKTERYKLSKLNLEGEKVTFHRMNGGVSHVKIPRWLTFGKIPDGANAEIEDFLLYIKKKYSL